MKDDREREDASRREERRVTPPGLGKLEHARPPEGGEPDLDKKADEEGAWHEYPVGGRDGPPHRRHFVGGLAAGSFPCDSARGI